MVSTFETTREQRGNRRGELFFSGLAGRSRRRQSQRLAAMGARDARLIIGLIERLRARGDIAIVMIAHNYAQTLEICDRVMLMQHGEVTF
jgi:hypothetical protein